VTKIFRTTTHIHEDGAYWRDIHWETRGVIEDPAAIFAATAEEV
jgi:hypothetical protein